MALMGLAQRPDIFKVEFLTFLKNKSLLNQSPELSYQYPALLWPVGSYTIQDILNVIWDYHTQIKRHIWMDLYLIGPASFLMSKEKKFNLNLF